MLQMAQEHAFFALQEIVAQHMLMELLILGFAQVRLTPQ
jgi:hypothetical protein